MGKGHDYVYVPLQNAISTINKPINLFALVVEFTLPKKTNGPELEHVGLSTLMEVFTQSKVEDFQSPVKPLVYRIRFTVEDSTARLHAYLYEEDGMTLPPVFSFQKVKFFDGYPDTDMLTSKMNKLLGITNGSSNVCGDVSNMRNPPWVQVGIKSYYLDKNDPGGSRHYRICDTKMVGRASDGW